MTCRSGFRHHLLLLQMFKMRNDVSVMLYGQLAVKTVVLFPQVLVLQQAYCPIRNGNIYKSGV